MSRKGGPGLFGLLAVTFQGPIFLQFMTSEDPIMDSTACVATQETWRTGASV